MVNVVSLLSFVTLLAIGQFLFKFSAVAITGLALKDAVIALATLRVFYAALALYGATTILWIWILTRVPLSLAYPFMALAMILVPLMGWYVFGERLSAAYWLGAALIIAGMLVMQLAA